MKLGALFSGGKDSTFALYLAKGCGYHVSCLVSIFSKNPYSYMFHTPSISKVEQQANAMDIPLLIHETEGEEGKELVDLEAAIKRAMEQYQIEGIITGAIESIYQASRIQRICNELDIECFNPLWQKDQFELLEDLIQSKFEVIITAAAAYPLDASWLGRKIDRDFIRQIRPLHEQYSIHPAGEGGEFETFVLDCPLFTQGLRILDTSIVSSDYNHRMEVTIG
ncbi:MAG: diphthine--ammonia ligase [ANME-2 cluster archaeon]|nr:diphthine--ammonia ligase [ANME-2 cluster archaeon]